MPEGVIADILVAAAESGAISEGTAFAAAEFIGTYGALIATVATIGIQAEMASRQAQAAKDAYNASLRDRYVMTRAVADPRQLVLGRQRVSGPMFYVGSYGPNLQNLVFTVALAGHEIDAVEAIYFDDEQVSLDADGNVIGVNRRDQFSITTATATFMLSSVPVAATLSAKVNYGSVITPLTVALTGDSTGMQVSVSGGNASLLGEVTITYQPNPSPYAPRSTVIEGGQVTLDASGNGLYTFASAPIAGSVNVVGQQASGGGPISDLSVNLGSYSSVSGSTVTISGATDFAGSPVQVSAQTLGSTQSFARVRWHLGQPGQVADAGMIAELPGVWTGAHVANNVAYLVCEFTYNQDAFPTGIPNVSAQIRGAKVFDPRSSSTAWSENPALLMRAAATHPLCGRLDPGLMHDASIIAAANVCDVVANYTVGGITYPLPIYTAGTVSKSGTKPADVLNSIAQAMVGKWTFIDGLFRIKAGSYVTPLQYLDETWLTDGQKVQIQPTANRADVYNTVTGKFADRQNDFQVLDFPQISAASYIAADGIPLPLDVPLNAVTFTAQAQQVVAAMMRDARQGLRLTVLCNMRAYPVEVFDTVSVSLGRFGWVNKPFEVYDSSWTVDGGIQLSMKEVDPGAWDLGTSFASTDPAPNTLLPSPFNVPQIVGLTCASGTAQLLKQSDGTIVSRILVSWTPLTDAAVVTGGGVQVRFGAVGDPESAWQTVVAQGSQSSVYLGGVQDGRGYLVMARAFNSLVQGVWCVQHLCIVVGKTAPPLDVTGLAATVVSSGVRFTWNQDTEADYSDTELRIGTSWETGVRLFFGAASSYSWLSPVVGTYTVFAKNYDTSGNPSVDPASVVVTVTASAAVSWSTLADKPLDLFNMCVTPQFEAGSAGGWGGTVVSASGQAWSKCLQVSVRDTFEIDSITPIAAGETIYGYADLDSEGTSFPVNFGAAFYNSAGAIIAFEVAGGIPAGTVWKRVGGSIVAPPAAVSLIPWLQIAGSSSFGVAAATNLYLGRAAPGATLGADWDVDVANIPYASVYNNDDSVTLGMSLQNFPAGPTFPAGSTYPVGWGFWASNMTLIRETTIVRAGPTSVRMQTTGAPAGGIVSTAVFPTQPLPVGTYVDGTIDFYLVAYTSGSPGALMRVYTNAALTVYNEIYITPPSASTGVWQRVPWSIRSSGAGSQIFGIQIYLMASPDGRAAPSHCDIVYDNLLFALYDSSTDNHAITINPDGTASGGPGGQVTITGLGYAGSLDATTNLELVAAGGTVLAGNSATGIGQVYSQDGYTGGAFISYVVRAPTVTSGSGANGLIGLSTSRGSALANIDFGIHCSQDGHIYRYDGGSFLQFPGSAWSIGDVLAVTYDGANVRYFHSGILLLAVPHVITAPLYLNGLLRSATDHFSNIQFGPLSAVTAIDTGQLSLYAATELVVFTDSVGVSYSNLG